MNVRGLDKLVVDAVKPAEPARAAQGPQFTQAMGDARQQEARKAAEQIVAHTLVLPLLQQMRDDPFKGELFDGGFAEQAFGAQLDTELAERIATRSGGPLVEAVYRQVWRDGGRLSVQG